MGTFRVTIEIGDPSGTRYRQESVLVDTGASHTALPGSLLRELGIASHTRGLFQLADGRQVQLDMGRTWIRIDGRSEITLVVFAAENTDPLLGAVTLEEFRLGVDPIARRLIPVPGLLMPLSALPLPLHND